MNIAMETHALCRDLLFIDIINRMASWSLKKYFIQALGEREAGRARGLLLWAGARRVPREGTGPRSSDVWSFSGGST